MSSKVYRVSIDINEGSGRNAAIYCAEWILREMHAQEPGTVQFLTGDPEMDNTGEVIEHFMIRPKQCVPDGAVTCDTPAEVSDGAG